MSTTCYVSKEDANDVLNKVETEIVAVLNKYNILVCTLAMGVVYDSASPTLRVIGVTKIAPTDLDPFDLLGQMLETATASVREAALNSMTPEEREMTEQFLASRNKPANSMAD